MSAPLNALALDGGGVRGIVAAAILAEVEKSLGAPAATVFDLFSGTSSGALIAILVATEAAGGKRKSALEVVSIFHDHAARIFPPHPLRGGPGRPAPYSSKRLRKVAEYLVGDGRLSDCSSHVVVPVYDMANATPYVFDTAIARRDPEHDYFLKDVVASAVAAPFYFAPNHLPSDRDHQMSRLLIDGGVYANNPSIVALWKAREHYASRELRLLSIATGGHRPLPSAHGRFDWNDVRQLTSRIRELLNIVLDASGDAATQAAEVLLGPEHFCRIETPLPANLDRLDDSRKETLDALLEQVPSAMTGRRIPTFLKRLV